MKFRLRRNMTLAEFLTLVRRAWRLYVMPPKERSVFLEPSTLPVVSRKLSFVKTAAQPKQVSIDHSNKLAYVTCMEGFCLQQFSFAEDNLKLLNQWHFDEQCVECEFHHGLVYLTTTNFQRGKLQSSHLWGFDPNTGKTISGVDTQGEWSKFIAIDDFKHVIFVSNWHSHDITVIDSSDPGNWRVLQKVNCIAPPYDLKSPRGLVMRPDGAVLGTSFYGSRIFAIAAVDNTYQITQQSAVFDGGGYGGNMRDILISSDGKTVWVTNLGRNMLHWYDSMTLELKGSILIPQEPNSMRFLDEEERILGVSCRKSGVVCLVDTEEKKPIGVSAHTEKLPTGLAMIEGGFIVTNFDDGSMELHTVSI